MADNVTLPGSGAVISTDDIAGVQVQRAKLAWGPDGTSNDADVASGKMLPIQLRHSDGTIISDASGLKLSTSQLAILNSTAQPMSTGFQLIDVPNNGTAARAAQLPTALGSAGGLKVDDLFGQYETVAASQSAQAMGATGATGDYLAYVMVFPGIAACGAVTILDNATTWGTFAGGGTTALPSLVPFRIDVGAYSTSGAWKITTGASVTAVGVGKFT